MKAERDDLRTDLGLVRVARDQIRDRLAACEAALAARDADLATAQRERDAEAANTDHLVGQERTRAEKAEAALAVITEALLRISRYGGDVGTAWSGYTCAALAGDVLGEDRAVAFGAEEIALIRRARTDLAPVPVADGAARWLCGKCEIEARPTYVQGVTETLEKHHRSCPSRVADDSVPR